MRHLVFAIACIWYSKCIGQDNLIPNASFEEYYDCDFDIISDPIESVIYDWYTRLGRPRYFREQCLDEISTIHSPFEGSGFLVLITLTTLIDEESTSLRDYTGVLLKENLIKGKDYYIEYYGAKSFSGQASHSDHGLRFTNNFINETDINIQRSNPPLIKDDAIVVDSKSFTNFGQWERHQHCFSPDSSYKYMVVGNFTHRDSLFHDPFDNIGGVGIFTSYDNFFLAEIEQEVRLNDYKENICAGDCITLATNHSLINGEFEWNLPGSDLQISADSTVTVCYDKPGVYDVQLRVQHCTGVYNGDFADAITVVDEIDFMVPMDVVLCPDEIFVFSVSEQFEIQWFDGQTENERSFDEPGIYEYIISNGLCEEEFSIEVEFRKLPNIEQEEIFECQGVDITFQGQTISESGIHIDTLIGSANCDSIYKITKFEFYNEMPIEFSGEFEFCRDESSELEIISDHTEVKWNDGYSEKQRTFIQEGSFIVEAIDVNGCPIQSNIEISILPDISVRTVDLFEVDFEVGIPLNVTYEGDIARYNWSDNSRALSCYDCPFPVLEIPEAGIYTVEITNEAGCRDVAELKISFNRIDVYVPNAIHPNSNLFENQIFYIQSNADINYGFQIFNRWGGLVYEADNLVANDPSKGWHPIGVISDVFVYVIKYLDEDGKEVLLKGSLSVF